MDPLRQGERNEVARSILRSTQAYGQPEPVSPASVRRFPEVSRTISGQASPTACDHLVRKGPEIALHQHGPKGGLLQHLYVCVQKFTGAYQ
jgi:hypothetical protein